MTTPPLNYVVFITGILVLLPIYLNVLVSWKASRRQQARHERL